MIPPEKPPRPPCVVGGCPGDRAGGASRCTRRVVRWGWAGAITGLVFGQMVTGQHPEVQELIRYLRVTTTVLDEVLQEEEERLPPRQP